MSGAALHESELEDLASIDLPDEFLEVNIDRPFNADYARKTLKETTELFVKAFLVDQGDNVTRLHHCLKDCASVLGGMEQVLQQFISQLCSIQEDIGHVREVLADTAVRLANTSAAEKVLWAAVSCLVVPPEVVQIVTQTSDEQLGTQFMLSAKELLKYLNYRKGTWRQTIAAADAGARPDSEAAALREVRFSLAECRVYYDLMSILDALTLYACIKIKAFLSKKLQILTTRNTNICIQQDHVLKQYSFYVHFLRSAVPLLRHVYSAPPPPPRDAPSHPPTPRSHSAASSVSASLNASGDHSTVWHASSTPTVTSASAHVPPVSGGPSSNVNTTLIPYRIVRALYEELKHEYCVIVSSIYLQKIQDYSFSCNSMEYSTEGSCHGPSGVAGGGGLFGFGPTASPPSPLSRSGAGGIGGGSSAGPNYSYSIPLLTDTSGGGTFVAMRLGERVQLLHRIFGPPLIPTMERAAKRKHTYEETLRSILSLTCDIVTHEYLFTFDFFSGDTSVYVDAFQPAVQFIVDYLSEVVLVNAIGATRRMLNERPHTSVNARAKQDTYGLLLLIRLCHEYRSMMRHTRKLLCLDGFFDSLLMLLWPAFNTCFGRQLNALMSAKNTGAMVACMAHLKRTEERLCFVHPVVKAFAEFSCVLLSLSFGATAAEERRAAAALRDMGTGAGARRQRRDSPAGGGRSAAGHGTTSDSGSPVSPTSDDWNAGDGGGAADAPDKHPAGSDEWAMALRRQALAKIDADRESDAADSRSHFLTLTGDVAFMRIELAHLVVQMGTDLVAAEPERQQRVFLEPLSKAFAINNLFYLLQVFCRYPVILVNDVPGSETREGDEGPAAGSVEVIPLEERDDMGAVRELYSRFRGEFVENVVRGSLGGFLLVVQDEDACAPEEVLQAANHFVLHWKSSLDNARQAIRRLLSDAGNAQETTAQTCMDILLYNTRFHAVIARFLERGNAIAAAGEANVFAGRSLRSLIVTNQLLLQHMRTFSIPLTE